MYQWKALDTYVFTNKRILKHICKCLYKSNAGPPKGNCAWAERVVQKSRKLFPVAILLENGALEQ